VGGNKAVRAATTWLVDDDFDLCTQLTTFVNQLHVEGYPAADTTRSVEACAHIHAHRTCWWSVLLIRGGGDRLYASYKETAQQQDRDNGAHRSTEPSPRIEPTQGPPAVPDAAEGWQAV